MGLSAVLSIRTTRVRIEISQLATKRRLRKCHAPLPDPDLTTLPLRLDNSTFRPIGLRISEATPKAVPGCARFSTREFRAYFHSRKKGRANERGCPSDRGDAAAGWPKPARPCGAYGPWHRLRRHWHQHSLRIEAGCRRRRGARA